MTEYVPIADAGVEPGWESQAHGPAPWLDSLDEAASYLEGTAFFVFWVDFGDVPAASAFWLDVQAWSSGFPVLRVSKTREDTGSVTPGVSADVSVYGDEWVDEQWSRGLLAAPLAHEGGPLTLWFRTTSDGGLWELWLSYLALVTERVIYRAPRRIFPRDDGLTGGARRTWPPSKGYQWGNRVDGSGYL